MILKGIAPVANSVALKTLDKLIEEKLASELDGSKPVLPPLDRANQHVDFGSFLYEAYIIKHGLKSTAINAMLSLYSVKRWNKLIVSQREGQRQ